MNTNQILRSDYLDLLFDGRNKNYGSYDLRKKYNQRMFLGASTAFLIFVSLFVATLIKPKEKILAEMPIETRFKLIQLPPAKEIKPPVIPHAILKTAKAKPMVKYTQMVIKKDNEVNEKDIPKLPDPKKYEISGPKNRVGDANPNNIIPNLAAETGSGSGLVIAGAHSKQNEIYHFVDQDPQPPGGMEAFQRYLRRNVFYPMTARQAAIQGRVVYQFIIDQQGKISDIKILKDIGGGCGDAVRKVLKNYQKHWTPGKNNGHPVNFYFTGTFNFTLQ